MTIVVGFGFDTVATAALDLGAALARTAGDDVLLCCVVPDIWVGAPLRDPQGIDVDWRNSLSQEAAAAIDDARTRVEKTAGCTVEAVVRAASSVPHALLHEGIERQASTLVLGSSTGGPFGRIALGSTSDRLVHSAQIPVAIPPRGARIDTGAITRLVLAIDASPRERQFAAAAADLAVWLGVQVAIVTFEVDDRAALTTFAAQDGIRDEWRSQVRTMQSRLATLIAERAAGTHIEPRGIASGNRWAHAVDMFDWESGDLLVLGSSNHGPLSRVFLGSTATRIVRASPVPVVLLPRR